MSNWKAFLENQGAQWGSHGIELFSQNPTPYPLGETTLLADLSHLGILTVTGPDAGKFLQGQVTCDIRELDQEASRLGAHCTHKGRMLFSFRAVKLGEEQIALRLDSDILAHAQQALGKYIVFSKAKLADASTDYCRLGLAGPKAAALIEQHLGATPVNINDVSQVESGYVIKISDQRFECWLKTESAEKSWTELSQFSQPVGVPVWNLLDIRDGLGDIRPGTEELFIPQMLNYQAIDGISFNKGCYTGQEVVARMQYRGKLKRPMYRVRFSLKNQPLPQPGAELYGSEKQQSIGNIVLAAPADDLSAEALAVITSDAADTNNVYLDQSNTEKLDILALPYAIT